MKTQGIYYLVGGCAGLTFLLGSYHANKYPMNNLWDFTSTITTAFFAMFVLIGIFKLTRKKK